MIDEIINNFEDILTFEKKLNGKLVLKSRQKLIDVKQKWLFTI